VGVLGLLALTACAPGDLGGMQPAPPPAVAPVEPGPVEPSAQSKALSLYYARLQQELITQGLLRQDGGGPDVPFTQRNLVENFIRIALFDEYTTRGGRLVERQTASRLRRWVEPVRFSVRFGVSVPKDIQVEDKKKITSYVSRLGRLTRHPVQMASTNANFTVLVVNEDERRGLGPLLRELVPGISSGSVRTVTNLPRSILCLVLAFSEGDDFSYTNAVAIVRAEHPDLMRLSCIHEELAQGMGLANDSPVARPSVFNDDEEFGLLTRHDELLLTMLYDPRMRIGMTAEQASPIADVIAAELLGGGS